MHVWQAHQHLYLRSLFSQLMNLVNVFAIRFYDRLYPPVSQSGELSPAGLYITKISIHLPPASYAA